MNIQKGNKEDMQEKDITREKAKKTNEIKRRNEK